MTTYLLLLKLDDTTSPRSLSMLAFKVIINLHDEFVGLEFMIRD
jgi:hypothetical protein